MSSHPLEVLERRWPIAFRCLADWRFDPTKSALNPIATLAFPAPKMGVQMASLLLAGDRRGVYCLFAQSLETPLPPFTVS